MTTFIESSADYLGPTVTVTPRHALDGKRGVAVCQHPHHPGCGALVVADGPLAGRDVDRAEHVGQHRRAV